MTIVDTSTVFFTYANNKIIIDSSVSSQKSYSVLNGSIQRNVFKTVQYYSYAGNKVYGFKQSGVLVNSSGNYITEYVAKDTAMLDAAGNVITASHRIVYNNPVEEMYRVSAMVYDNNPSALSKLNIAETRSIFEDHYTDVQPGLTHKNNILKITETTYYNTTGSTPSTETEDYTGKYNYNPCGLPGFLNIILTAGNANKQVFIYRSLP